MINRVNGNDYHDYSQLKMPDAADKTGNGEKFSLNYQYAKEKQEDEDEKAKAGEGKDAKISGGSGKRTVMQSGVRLELSGNAQSDFDTKHGSVASTQSAGEGLFNAIRSWITAFAQAVKDFLYKVWNDETPSNVTVEENEQGVKAVQGAESVPDAGSTESTDEPERLTEEYLALRNLENLRKPEDAARQQLRHDADKNKEIQKYLRSGNLEQVLNIVTQNGQKTMAKNSTLLTYYDRTGKITPLSASDQERILHGDRNVKKL